MRRRNESNAGNARNRNGGVRRGQAGVSMLELTMVIALLAILTGIIGHSVGGEPERARQLRAATEVETLAQALRTFKTTVGQWPTLDAGGRRDGVRVLLSGPRMPSANPWVGAHAFFTWSNTARGDLMHNHLLVNAPAGQSVQRYPTTGDAGWRGPYLETCPLDPWGRPYVANVIVAHSPDAVNHRRLFVLSAGPDGRWQTNANATAQQRVAGDDIGCLVWQR